MSKIVLNGQIREKNENLKALRAERIIPGVVYGSKQENINIKLGNSDLLSTYRQAGENHIVELNVDGKKIDVIIYDVQRHPVSGNFVHIDFLAINKLEKIEVEIPLEFTGISKAKTEENAVIEEVLKTITVKCLPKDLTDSFEVNLSLLEKTGDNIKVSDLNISDKFELITNETEVIALASATREEVEEVEEEIAEEGAENAEGATDSKEGE